jgi:hypothetical protein
MVHIIQRVIWVLDAAILLPLLCIMLVFIHVMIHNAVLYAHCHSYLPCCGRLHHHFLLLSFSLLKEQISHLEETRLLCRRLNDLEVNVIHQKINNLERTVNNMNHITQNIRYHAPVTQPWPYECSYMLADNSFVLVGTLVGLVEVQMAG